MNHSCTKRGSEKGWFRSVLIAGSLALGVASGGWATVVAPTPGFDGATAGALRPNYESYITARNGVAAEVSSVAHLSAFTLASHAAAAIPAFARKYNLACSACHTAWPELNAFGQAFKDRGYQLGNDRDSPIWVNPSYWPVAIRTTPGWHLEETTDQPVDDGAGGTEAKTITQAGFDISGADLLMLGTLYKNITFGFVPTFEDGEGVGIEAAFVRFDNLFKSSWANLKIGKFELDNMLSEKRIITLSNNGSFYQSYHFLPVGDGTTFGLGDNQIGVGVAGPSTEQLQSRERRDPEWGRRRSRPAPGEDLRWLGHPQPGLRRRQARAPAHRGLRVPRVPAHEFRDRQRRRGPGARHRHR